MQLKGLVKIFTILLILISVYQLSFTWIVRSHENKMKAKAEKTIKATVPSAEQKYAGNQRLISAYNDSISNLIDAETFRLLDSTESAKIGPFGLTTYKNAKEQELMLGLDLQGGISVTMEVGFDQLVRNLSDNTKDPNIVKAIENATVRKNAGETDYINMFVQEFNTLSNGANLAPFFVNRSNGAVKFNSTNNEVQTYLNNEANAAFENTTNIMRTRIDRFGVASPAINPDPNKGVITIELAGAKDPERVRNYLQSTANLQFFEVYNLQDFGDQLMNAQNALAAYLKSGVDTSATVATPAVTDTVVAPVVAQTDSVSRPQNDSQSAFAQVTGSAPAATATAGQNDSLAKARMEAPFSSLLAGGPDNSGYIVGYVHTSDTAQMNRHINNPVFTSRLPGNLKLLYGRPQATEGDLSKILPIHAIKTLENGMAPLEGEHVTKASQGYDQVHANQATVEMSMDAVGSRLWADLTKKNINKPIAIVLDGIVLTAPNVNTEITGGNSVISGNFTVVEAQDMANILQSGKLKAPAKIVQEQVIGPTLGQAAIKGGLLAFGLSFLVIFALMLLYYNTSGWIANIALILNLLFTLGILSALGFTLTAPGIAGLVLTIGMAVDANVIIFERIKEEIKRGRSHYDAVNLGYKRSYAPVLDGHITSLLTAFILFYFGLGPVLGFATTQIIGLLLSMFCGILVSRLISEMYTTKDRHFKYFTKLSERIFNHRQFDFVKYRKVAYVISAIIILLGIGTIFVGFDQGVEFAGGRSYTVRFADAPNQESVRNDLAAVYEGESPVIKTVDNNNQLNITTSYKIEDRSETVDAEVEQKLYTGLQKYLPQGVSFDEFKSNNIQSSQTVLPSISEDLKRGATKATLLAVLAIVIYILIRFRDWRYSMGTIASLIHDVLVTLIVFSYFKNIVPFPLEIDQHFIAAILTVIGFSMNDTVVIFDRIREDSRNMRNTDKKTIINKALNETLSRTIMTSLTVFLTILILFIFGGETLRGFSFAMLIGVLTGIYSSVFVAAPILIDVAKNKPFGQADDTHVKDFHKKKTPGTKTV